MSRTDTTTERPTMSARTMCARATALTLALGGPVPWRQRWRVPPRPVGFQFLRRLPWSRPRPR